jgi:hypothetical protein
MNRENCHKGTKTQSKTECKNLSLCFGVLVAKMFCHSIRGRVKKQGLIIVSGHSGVPAALQEQYLRLTFT